MAERSPAMREPELEAALAELERELAYPPTPDLALSVRQRLAEQSARAPRWWRTLLPSTRRMALALLTLLLVGGALLALSPAVRDVVAERLGLRGVQIREIQTRPTSAPAPAAPVAPIGSRLNLGQATTLGQVRGEVAFQVELPAALGAPDEVYLLNTPPGGQVALVYHPRADLPQAHTSGVGLLLTEFQGDVRATGALGKGVPPGTRLEEVQVNAGRAFWLEGDPHVFFYLDAQGRVASESTRLAGNVLLWEHGGLTLRLESALSRDAAVGIAASVR